MFSKLIMVIGSCPGAGKTTITRFLSEEFEARGVSTECLFERTFTDLDVFAPQREDLGNKKKDNRDILLGVARALIKESIHSPKIHLVDAYLPGYQFLFGLYSASSISKYNVQLFEIMSVLNPMIIYLKSDMSCAFSRVFKTRGQRWLGRLLKNMNWCVSTGRYGHSSQPLVTLQDVFEFYKQMDQFSQDLVKKWQGKNLIIDTTSQTIDEVKKLLIDALV